MHSSIVFEAIIELNRSGDMSCALTLQHTTTHTNMYALFALFDFAIGDGTCAALSVPRAPIRFDLFPSRAAIDQFHCNILYAYFSHVSNHFPWSNICILHQYEDNIV
jgi:hypothetical protein